MVKITENSGITRNPQQIKNKSVVKKDSISKKDQVKNIPDKSPLSDTVILTSKINESIENSNYIEKYTALFKKYEENQLRNLEKFSVKNKSGCYEKEEVISDTTENIVNHPGFFKSSSISTQNSIQENLAEIKKDIELGKYNSDAVIENVAEKLLSTIISPLVR